MPIFLLLFHPLLTLRSQPYKPASRAWGWSQPARRAGLTAQSPHLPEAAHGMMSCLPPPPPLQTLQRVSVITSRGERGGRPLPLQHPASPPLGGRMLAEVDTTVLLGTHPARSNDSKHSPMSSPAVLASFRVPHFTSSVQLPR